MKRLTEYLNNGKRKNVLVLIIIFLPLLQAGIIALYCMAAYKSALPVPQWNDEGAYYTLIKTWLATGQPLGYWGFDGGHAILGTGSAWSPAILFPYAVFGMMFGWHYSSVFYANLLFLTLAQVLFLLLVKPERKMQFRMFLLQAVSSIVLLYSVTLMSELLRFSLAIILAGMIYRLYFGKCGPVFRFVIMPLFLLAAIQIYIFFVFAVPLYVFGAMKDCKSGTWWKKALVSLTALLFAGGASYYLLHLISSNYNIYKTENLLKALQSFDIMAVFRAVLSMVKEGLAGFAGCFLSHMGHGLFQWFVPFLIVLLFLPFGVLCADGWKMRNKKQDFWDRDHILCAQGVFGAALFLGAFITVYSLEPFTFFRSMGIVVLFTMYLLMMTERKRLFSVLLLFYGAGMIFLPANLKDFTKERYPGQETVREWRELETELEAQITLRADGDPWKNTVVLYTLEPKVLAAMPAGSGVNMMLYSDEIPEKAEYLFFSKESVRRRSDWLEHDYAKIRHEHQDLLMEKYQAVWESEKYILYKKIG